MFCVEFNLQAGTATKYGWLGDEPEQSFKVRVNAKMVKIPC